LLASFREGSPNIIKEALACNLPIVSVDVGDVPERLRGVHPSRIVAREPYEIGCALAEVLSLGQRSNGREAVQECSETQIAAIIAGVYRSAATTKGLSKSKVYKSKLYSLFSRRWETIRRWRRERNFRRPSGTGFVC
jgi:glycosyltransferase involved in cell wall biosynthesis